MYIKDSSTQIDKECLQKVQEKFVRMRLFEAALFAAGQVKDESPGTSHEYVDLSFSSLPGREQSVLQAGKKQ